MELSIDKFDLIVGFFVFIGLVAMACLTAFLAGPDLFDLGSIEAKTYLPSTYSLKRGVPVSYLEMQVGHVRSVELYELDDPQKKVEVVFTVKRKYKDVIRKNFRTSLEASALGGIISGNIILGPPEGEAPGPTPVENGDILEYHASANLLGDVTALSSQLQEELLPKVKSILTEFETFMKELNDPKGEVRLMLTDFRKIAGLLADPNGKLQDTLNRVNDLAVAVTDENNLVMKMIRNKELFDSLNETLDNLNKVSENGLGITENADAALETIYPQVDEVLKNLLQMQAELTVLMRDAQTIAATVALATQGLPSLMGDVQNQLRELEDITAAVKNIFIVRWNLEDEPHGDGLLLKPLLLQQTEQEDSRK